MMKHDALPAAWSQGRRAFWTKRKKTALSLVTVLVVLAGIAVAFKLFDQTVPNNVVRDASSFNFQVWKKDAAVPDPAYIQTGPSVPVFSATDASSQPISNFPGDDRSVSVRINNTNTVTHDASFYVYADALTVKDQNGVAPAPADAAKFLGFFSLHVEKEKILTSNLVGDIANEDDHGVLEGTPNATPRDKDSLRQYGDACSDAIRSITRQNPCKLGVIKGSGQTDLIQGSTDHRYYNFHLVEADTDTDQSAYEGWTLTFNLVFQARVPAEAETVSVIGER